MCKHTYSNHRDLISLLPKIFSLPLTSMTQDVLGSLSKSRNFIITIMAFWFSIALKKLDAGKTWKIWSQRRSLWKPVYVTVCLFDLEDTLLFGNKVITTHRKKLFFSTSLQDLIVYFNINTWGGILIAPPANPRTYIYR